MRLPFAFLTALCFTSIANAAGPLEIRFNTPATDWESQALPIGNGRMGAMIYGDPLAERMQFNPSEIGLTELAPIGTAVGPDRPLCVVHARTDASAQAAAERIRAAYTIGRTAPVVGPAVRERIVAPKR